jgi:hypothetical protein
MKKLGSYLDVKHMTLRHDTAIEWITYFWFALSFQTNAKKISYKSK